MFPDVTEDSDRELLELCASVAVIYSCSCASIFHFLDGGCGSLEELGDLGDWAAGSKIHESDNF